MTQSTLRRRPRAPRTLWSLAVLGLLRERAMHPYEMQRLLHQRHTDALLALKRGSLYHAINQLQRADLIEPLETSREGRWPERTVYRITSPGAEELTSWVRDMLSTPSQEASQFVGGLTHILHLTPDDALVQLQLRQIGLDARIASMTAVEVGVSQLVGRAAILEVEYARCIAAAELAWVRSLTDDLRDGKLQWKVDEIHIELNNIQSEIDLSRTGSAEGTP